MRIILLLLLTGAQFAYAAGDIFSLSKQIQQTFEAKDYQSALRHLNIALEIAPKHPSFLYYQARALMLTGQQDQALKNLEEIVALGAAPPEHADFASVQNSERWKAIAKQSQLNKTPTHMSDVAFLIPQKDLILEGTAYDPVRKTFYTGSIYRRKILAIDPDGKVRDFAAEKQDGLWGPLGMEVDPERRWLWVNHTNLGEEMPMIDPDPTTKGHTGVFKYDITTGKLIQKYLLAEKDKPHGFNDLAVARNGDVYITDSSDGSVYKIAASKDSLEVLIPTQTFSFPNGIALSLDNRLLYVADIAGLTIVDLRTMKQQKMENPAGVALTGIDGMVFYKDSLVIVGGILGVDRVVRLFLDSDGKSVVRAKVLEANHPLFSLPTTGVMADSSLYYIANSQLRSFDEKGNIFPCEKLQDSFILKVKVD
ncbi:SMP-30/gluconolactonase/LRE family protein [bacterium]|nr:SMP-30/gluconolactonase/LRE family protein [bacterium]